MAVFVHVLLSSFLIVRSASFSTSQSLDKFFSRFPFPTEGEAIGKLSIIAGATSGWEDKEPEESGADREESGILGQGLPELALLCISKLKPTEYLYNTLPEFRFPGLWIDNVAVSLGTWTVEMGSTLTCELWECDGLRGCSYFTTSLPDMGAGDDFLGSLDVHLEDFRGGASKDCIYSLGASEETKAIFRLSCPDCALHLEENIQEIADQASATEDVIGKNTAVDDVGKDESTESLPPDGMMKVESPEMQSILDGNLNRPPQEQGAAGESSPPVRNEPPDSENAETQLPETILSDYLLQEEPPQVEEANASSGDMTVVLRDDLMDLPNADDLELSAPIAEGQEFLRIENEQSPKSDGHVLNSARRAGTVLDLESADSSHSDPNKTGISTLLQRSKLKIVLIGCSVVACLWVAAVALVLARSRIMEMIPYFSNLTASRKSFGGGRPNAPDIRNVDQIRITNKPNEEVADITALRQATGCFSQEVILAATPQEVVRIVHNDPLRRPRNVFMLKDWNPVAGISKPQTNESQ